MDENVKKELDKYIEENYVPGEEDKRLTCGIYPTIIKRENITKYEIIIYEKIDGKSPPADFIRSLEPKMKARVLKEIELLSDKGIYLREPYSKVLKNGLFELRIKVGTDLSRIIYFFFKNNKIILTNGFIKKQQKTPKSEIELAIKYKSDWEERQKNEI